MPHRRFARLFGALLLSVVHGCAHGEGAPSYRARAGTADARFGYYGDDQGLSVVTVAVLAEQPIAREVAITAQAVIDHVAVRRSEEVHQAGGNQATGHQHEGVDAVTSASVSVTGGDSLDKTRYEGTLGAAIDLGSRATPVQMRPSVRVSSEPDYQSYSGRLSTTFELAERNTTLATFIGYGHDRSDPIEAPPGEGDRWPATNERIVAGVSLNQALASSLSLSAGAAGSRQIGTLESPYRRAIVRTTLFPEKLPHHRERLTGYVGAAWYLGWDTALHLRQGVYVDSWDIVALIPQVSFVKELGADWLVSIRYRYYTQSAAAFYAPSYTEVESLRSGDMRLGKVREHSGGAEVRWDAIGEPNAFGALSLTAGYELSLLRHPQAGHGITAHIAAFGVSTSY